MKLKLVLALGATTACAAGLLALGTLDDKFINSRGSIFLNLDLDNNDLDELLQITSNGASSLVTVTEDGLVGIGTQDPSAALDVRGKIESRGPDGGELAARNPNDQSAQVLLSWLDDVARVRIGGSGVGANNGLDIQGPGDVSLMRIRGDGLVGIGTDMPAAALHLRGTVPGIVLQDSTDLSTWSEMSDGTIFQLFKYSDGVANIDLNPAPFNDDAARIRIFRSTNTAGPKQVLFHRGDGTGTVDAQIGTGTAKSYFQLGGGNFGIGTDTPSADLDVAGITKTDRIFVFGDPPPPGSFETDPMIYSRSAFNSRAASLEQPAGTPGAFQPPVLSVTRNVTADSSPNLPIVWVGTKDEGDVYNGVFEVTPSRVRVQELEITGADVAERFPVSEAVQPGMVLAIDPEHPGQLCLARKAYDRRVAGVVSGANGLPVGAILGNLQGSQDGPAVALSGRVWVQCDAGTGGPITPGDLLTTSDTPGHAMKVTDHARAQGAILGKAMSSLSEGKGLVLVLVSLQ